MNTLKATFVSGLVALTLSAPSIAQEKSDNGQNYEPTYFEQYAPRTALDMVGRIPGFQLKRADNKRGLGNGGANVLINGKRISGKTDARDQLSRITTPSVVRIEIVDGTSLDIPGLSGQVANVITKTTGLSGTWEWRPEFRRDRKARWLDGEVTVSGQTGDVSYSTKLSSNIFRNGHTGPETLFTPDGTIFEIREEDGQFYGENAGISGNLTWKPKPEHVVNFNAEYNQFNFNGREISQRTAITPRGITQDTLFSNAEDEWNAELGGDYEFPAGPKNLDGKLKLIGYYRTEHSPFVSRFDVFDPVLGQIDGSRFFQTADESETIIRAEYSFNKGEGEDWQIGVEGASNTLETESNFLVFDSNGVFAEQALDDPNSRVEEKRAEATLTHTHKFSDALDLQASIGGEYSEISQTGNTGNTREFFRPKGFISSTYKPNKTFSIRTKIERKVGQLDFFDFVSSVSVQDDFNTTGNSDIVPAQSWLGEVEFDKDFGQGSTFKVRAYGELISDLVDRIPIGVNGDAVGNIDSAHLYGIELTSTIKGERWGYKGLELELGLQLQQSSVDDPLTGISRRLGNDLISEWDISFSHDVQNSDWAYGIGINRNVRAPSFRLSTINTFTFPTPFAYAFVEHKNIMGLKVKVFALNLLDSTDDFNRQIFTDRRDIGVLDFTENRSRDFGLFGRLVVSGTF